MCTKWNRLTFEECPLVMRGSAIFMTRTARDPPNLNPPRSPIRRPMSKSTTRPRRNPQLKKGDDHHHSSSHLYITRL